MPKTKHPSKITGQANTRTVLIDGQPFGIDESLQVRNASPTGFNWGYGGSGPAQLALAICLLYLPAPKALAAHQLFKWQIVCNLEPDFELDGKELEHWFKNWKQNNPTAV